MKIGISLISFEQLQIEPHKLLLSSKLRKQIGKNERAFSCFRESDRNMVIAETLEIFNGICNHCRNVKGIVVCHTCQALLCPECDSTFHLNHIAHDRVILQGVIQKLKSVQHVDLLGKVQDRGMILVFFILIDTIFINI